MSKPTRSELFWAKVEKTPGCWHWTAALDQGGYGRFGMGTGVSMTPAHRYSYKELVGPIPPGFHIDHICHVRNCVNPAHLRLATPKQNLENLLGPRSNSTTGVRGVFWEKRRNKWRAQVTHYGKSVHVGYMDTIEEAEAAVSAKRRELFTHSDMDFLDTHTKSCS